MSAECVSSQDALNFELWEEGLMKKTMSFGLLFAAAAFLLSQSPECRAEDYPNRPIHLVVPYPAGGPTDILARVVGDKLGERLHQSVIVENKPGGSSVIGMEYVAHAAADGYTILVNASLHVIVPSILAKLPVYPIKDFAPVSQLGAVPLIMVVNKDDPAKTAADVIARARANPGKLTFGSSGVGASSHLAGAMLMKITGTKMLHVPYRGSAPALRDVLAGHITFMIDTSPASIGFVKSGSLKAVGVSTPKRLPILPDVPTISESGVKDYDVQSWYGVWMPAGTPKAIVKKVSNEISEIFKMPEVQKHLAALGTTPISSTPEEFGAFERAELKRWADLIKATSAKAE
jgi:tripartite-type tricarboxylate transporter receptor subunit TctC